jgi:KUP system potassium uptake protein
MSSSEHTSPSLGRTALLSLGALGIVFGDIGTSPLYALRECFAHGSGLPPLEGNIIGVVSLIIWGLFLVVALKYVIVVMRADNKGEGGVLALMAFALGGLSDRRMMLRQLLMYLGLFGSALIYGDGVITPAISVLSAVEGLAIVTPFFEQFVVPVAVIVIVLLFLLQSRGTGKIGGLFGPIILLWFVVMGVLGLAALSKAPVILAALSPLAALDFIRTNGVKDLHILGSVFLAFTGAEALYADMGHFGKRPIRVGWFSVVFPCLVVNYLGQGALIISQPQAIEHPFFKLAPEWALVPLVILATLATVIASQALISGAFSLTSQACQLGYFPRLNIRHTSHREVGQIYIPLVNTLLLLATLSVVLAFRSSTALAAAYGIAVSTTMVITTLLLLVVARSRWSWNWLVISLVFIPFFSIDMGFFLANAVKFFQGGWFPLLFATIVFTLMTTWWTGKRLLWARLRAQLVPFVEFFSTLDRSAYAAVPGIAVFMARDPYVTPPGLTFNLKYNKVLHEKVVFLTFVTESSPYVDDDGKIHIRDLGRGFYRIIVHHGFMERPDVAELIAKDCKELFPSGLTNVGFFLDRAIPLATSLPGMALWREFLFVFMMQNSLRATSFYDIPAEQVFEIGFQVEI